MKMAQICEEVKLRGKMRYVTPLRVYGTKRAHTRVIFPSKAFTKPTKPYDFFEPIKAEVCINEAPLRDFKRIIDTERKVLDKTWRESSLKLCSRLRVNVGLSGEFEADETALANLDGFLADLVSEEVDATELVKAARRRL